MSWIPLWTVCVIIIIISIIIIIIIIIFPSYHENYSVRFQYFCFSNDWTDSGLLNNLAFLGKIFFCFKSGNVDSCVTSNDAVMEHCLKNNIDRLTGDIVCPSVS